MTDEPKDTEPRTPTSRTSEPRNTESRNSVPRSSESRASEPRRSSEGSRRAAAVEPTDEGDDSEPVESEGSQRERSSRRPQSSRELLEEQLLNRASRADSKLRAQLTGKLSIRITDKQESYLFDWTANPAKIEKGVDGSGADCSIAISDDNLLRIASGDLNPQIAMLSGKIAVAGRSGLAVYFFNLIAPKQLH